MRLHGVDFDPGPMSRILYCPHIIEHSDSPTHCFCFHYIYEIDSSFYEPLQIIVEVVLPRRDFYIPGYYCSIRRQLRCRAEWGEVEVMSLFFILNGYMARQHLSFLYLIVS